MDIARNTEKFLTYAQEGNVSDVESFLRTGMNPNAKDKHGNTALMLATLKGHKNVIQALLENGADANAGDNYGRTALSAASEFGHTEIIQILLDKGADINVEGNFGKTAIMRATARGHADIIRLLKEADTKAGEMIFLETRQESGLDVVQVPLRESVCPRVQDGIGGATLILAAENGDTETITNLLESGVDPNSRDEYAATALLRAAQEGHSDIVKVLLENGADVNAEDEDCLTAMMWAAIEGRIDIMVMLKDAGASDYDAALPLLEKEKEETDKSKCPICKNEPKPEHIVLRNDVRVCKTCLEEKQKMSEKLRANIQYLQKTRSELFPFLMKLSFWGTPSFFFIQKMFLQQLDNSRGIAIVGYACLVGLFIIGLLGLIISNDKRGCRLEDLLAQEKAVQSILKPVYALVWPTPPDWTERRKEVIARDLRRCQTCGRRMEGSRVPFHVHHIIPKSERESNHRVDNLKLLCEICHSNEPSSGHEEIAKQRRLRLERGRQRKKRSF